MAKLRSPNYPAISLPDALDEAQKIWDKEKRTPVSMDVLGKAMGYSSVSGPVRTKVAALRKYGLLEQNGGRYSLSDLAMKILHSQPDERAQGLAVAAQRPELFKELYATHADASDAALKSELVVHRSFSEAGAKQFIKAFRDTMSIAQLADVAKSMYDAPESGDNSEHMTSGSAQEHPKNASQTQGASGSHANAWTWTLSIPRNVRAELKIAGDVTRDDVRRLKQQIEFLEESFEEEQ
jgi:hypothetical protein